MRCRVLRFLPCVRAPPVVPACIRCRGNVRPGKTDYGSVWGTDRFSGKAMRKKEAADASEQITAQIRRLLEDPC